MLPDQSPFFSTRLECSDDPCQVLVRFAQRSRFPTWSPSPVTQPSWLILVEKVAESYLRTRSMFWKLLFLVLPFCLRRQEDDSEASLNTRLSEIIAFDSEQDFLHLVARLEVLPDLPRRGKSVVERATHALAQGKGRTALNILVDGAKPADALQTMECLRKKILTG